MNLLINSLARKLVARSACERAARLRARNFHYCCWWAASRQAPWVSVRVWSPQDHPGWWEVYSWKRTSGLDILPLHVLVPSFAVLFWVSSSSSAMTYTGSGDPQRPLLSCRWLEDSCRFCLLLRKIPHTEVVVSLLVYLALQRLFVYMCHFLENKGGFPSVSFQCRSNGIYQSIYHGYSLRDGEK